MKYRPNDRQTQTRLSLANRVALRVTATDTGSATTLTVEICPMLSWHEPDAPVLPLAYCPDFWITGTRAKFKQDLEQALHLLAAGNETQQVFERIIDLVSQNELEL